ncbi:MAG: hypothetical protein ABFR36_06965 [Acidobacteriota bacterium]
MRDKNNSREYYFQLSEYLQIACNGMHSVKMNILESNSLIGTITIEKGKLLNATDNNGEGEDAFRRLVLNKKIEVELKQLGNNEKKKTINMNCEELIFRIFTTKDKERSISNLTKKAGNKLSPIETKINRGLEMLIEKKYKDAKNLFDEVVNESPGNNRAQQILKRLNELL